MRMPYILVSGARGTIGTNVCLTLGRQQRESVAVDISDVEPDAVRRCDDEIRRKIIFEKADITDFPRLTEIIQKYPIEGIINAAAIIPPRGAAEEIKYIRDAINVNLIGLVNLLELSRQNNLKIVHLSSGSVYKERTNFEISYKEDEPKTGHVVHLYSLLKFFGDLLCEYYQNVHQVEVRIARPSRVFGPPEIKDETQRLPPDFIIPAVVKGEMRIKLPYGYQKSHGGTFKTPEVYTELSYVKDVADGIVKLYYAKRENLKQSAYNISGGRLYSLDEIIDTARKIFPGKKIEVVLSKKEEFKRAIRPPLDINAARSDLGYKPMPLEAAMRNYAEWLSTMLGK